MSSGEEVSLPVSVMGSGWMALARCTGADVADFFPRDGEQTKDALARAQPVARRLCVGCPVRTECAAVADENRDEGLWGGEWRYPDNSRRDKRYTKRNLLEGL